VTPPSMQRLQHGERPWSALCFAVGGPCARPRPPEGRVRRGGPGLPTFPAEFAHITGVLAPARAVTSGSPSNCEQGSRAVTVTTPFQYSDVLPLAPDHETEYRLV